MALNSGAAVESVFYSPQGLDQADVALLERCQAGGLRVYELEPGVLAQAADTVTPQPLAAIVNMVRLELSVIDPALRTPVVVCAEVRDPGNAGTILRSAEASGAQAVIFSTGSVDAFNPKTVRASAGTLFQLPVINHADLDHTLSTLAGMGFTSVGTVPRGGVDYDLADLSGNVAFVLGNEAHGLSPDLVARLDLGVTIPMVGNAESLNVGISSAVLCFESLRQRRSVTQPATRT